MQYKMEAEGQNLRGTANSASEYNWEVNEPIDVFFWWSEERLVAESKFLFQDTGGCFVFLANINNNNTSL